MSFNSLDWYYVFIKSAFIDFNSDKSVWSISIKIQISYKINRLHKYVINLEDINFNAQICAVVERECCFFMKDSIRCPFLLRFKLNPVINNLVYIFIFLQGYSSEVKVTLTSQQRHWFQISRYIYLHIYKIIHVYSEDLIKQGPYILKKFPPGRNLIPDF